MIVSVATAPVQHPPRAPGTNTPHRHPFFHSSEKSLIPGNRHWQTNYENAIIIQPLFPSPNRGPPMAGDSPPVAHPACPSGHNDAPVTARLPGGVRSCVHWKDGKKNGPARWWHGNGRLWIEAAYRDGELHGPFREYRPNGQPRCALTFYHGAPLEPG